MEDLSPRAKSLSIIPHITGGLSVLGSSYISLSVLRQRRKRRRTSQRILLGMSLCDIISSFAYFLSTWPLPQGVNEGWGDPYHYAAVGNEATCTAQGVMIQFGVVSAFYNVALSLQYLLVVRYNVPEQTLRKKYAMWMLTVPPMLALGLTLPGIFLGMYANSNLWCWIATNWESCPADQPEICVRKTNIYRFIFYYGPLWASIGLTLAAQGIIWKTVKEIERKSRRYVYRVGRSSLMNSGLGQSVAVVAANANGSPGAHGASQSELSNSSGHVLGRTVRGDRVSSFSAHGHDAEDDVTMDETGSTHHTTEKQLVLEDSFKDEPPPAAFAASDFSKDRRLSYETPPSAGKKALDIEVGALWARISAESRSNNSPEGSDGDDCVSEHGDDSDSDDCSSESSDSDDDDNDDDDDDDDSVAADDDDSLNNPQREAALAGAAADEHGAIISSDDANAERDVELGGTSGAVPAGTDDDAAAVVSNGGADADADKRDAETGRRVEAVGTVPTDGNGAISAKSADGCTDKLGAVGRFAGAAAVASGVKQKAAEVAALWRSAKTPADVVVDDGGSNANGGGNDDGKSGGGGGGVNNRGSLRSSSVTISGVGAPPPPGRRRRASSVRAPPERRRSSVHWADDDDVIKMKANSSACAEDELETARRKSSWGDRNAGAESSTWNVTGGNKRPASEEGCEEDKDDDDVDQNDSKQRRRSSVSWSENVDVRHLSNSVNSHSEASNYSEGERSVNSAASSNGSEADDATSRGDRARPSLRTFGIMLDNHSREAGAAGGGASSGRRRRGSLSEKLSFSRRRSSGGRNDSVDSGHGDGGASSNRRRNRGGRRTSSATGGANNHRTGANNAASMVEQRYWKEEDRHAYRQSRKISRQALLYFMVFFVTWFPYTFTSLVMNIWFKPSNDGYWMLLVIVICQPLQGFLNCLVYNKRSIKRSLRKCVATRGRCLCHAVFCCLPCCGGAKEGSRWWFFWKGRVPPWLSMGGGSAGVSWHRAQSMRGSRDTRGPAVVSRKSPPPINQGSSASVSGSGSGSGGRP